MLRNRILRVIGRITEYVKRNGWKHTTAENKNMKMISNPETADFSKQRQ